MRKILISFLCILSLSITSCSTNVTDPGGSQTYILSGQAGGDNASGKRFDFYVTRHFFAREGTVVGSTIMGAANIFSVGLNVPPDSCLIPVKQFNYPFYFAPSVNVSDTNVKLTGNFYVHYFNDTNGIAGQMFRLYSDSSSIDPVPGDMFTSYVYATGNTSITGRYVDPDYLPGSVDSNIVNANLNFTTGWNVYTSIVNRYDSDVFEFTIMNGEIPGSDWKCSNR